MTEKDLPTVSEETPLLPQAYISKRNYRQQLISQGFSFIYNIETCSLYFVSANGFLKHISEANYAPSFITNHLATLDHDITEFAESWDIYILISFILATAVLFITNQRSIPERINEVFGWQNKKAESSCCKCYVVSETFITALWKVFVSSSSLLALIASIPYIGFWGGVAITLLAFPGNVFAQTANFLEPFFPKCLCFNLPETARKILAGYFAFGYAVSNMGLYWNTVDQGLLRIGWLPERLLMLPSLSLRIIINTVHGIFNATFGWQTIKHYYHRIGQLLSQDKRSNLEDNNPPPSTSHNLNDYSFWDRVGFGGAASSFYKVAATFLSAVIAISFAWSFRDITTAKGFVLVILLLSQFPNFFAQLSFYSETNQSLFNRNAIPGKNGLAGSFQHLQICFK